MDRFPVTNEIDLVDRYPLRRFRKARGRERTAPCLQGTDAARCVDEYMQCLQDHHAMESRNADKRFAHAYLAAMRDPLARVGEGAQGGVWNFESPAFATLTRFLRDLAAQGA